jgi:hypothetical protein
MLAMHPEIGCEGQSSPLCNILLGIRRMASEDQFMLSQLDNSFVASYGHLQAAMTGFLRGWMNDDADKAVVVDKNRAWLHCIELALTLAPETKMIVCLREHPARLHRPSGRLRPVWSRRHAVCQRQSYRCAADFHPRGAGLAQSHSGKIIFRALRRHDEQARSLHGAHVCLAWRIPA